MASHIKNSIQVYERNFIVQLYYNKLSMTSEHLEKFIQIRCSTCMKNITKGNLGLAETLAHIAYVGATCLVFICKAFGGSFGLRNNLVNVNLSCGEKRISRRKMSRRNSREGGKIKPSPVLSDILSRGEVGKVNLSCGEKRISRRRMSRRNSREGRKIKPSPVLSDILSRGEVEKNKPSPVLTQFL